jgi:hypothetical protein
MDEPLRKVMALLETCRSMTAIPKRFRPSVDASIVATVASLLVDSALFVRSNWSVARIEILRFVSFVAVGT